MQAQVVDFPTQGVSVGESTQLHLWIADIRELWGRGVLSDVAYVALVLSHLRSKSTKDGKVPPTLDVDTREFLSLYGDWEGVTATGKEAFKEMTAPDLLKAIAALDKKRVWEFASLPTQLSLGFLG